MGISVLTTRGRGNGRPVFCGPCARLFGKATLLRIHYAVYELDPLADRRFPHY